MRFKCMMVKLQLSCKGSKSLQLWLIYELAGSNFKLGFEVAGRGKIIQLSNVFLFKIYSRNFDSTKSL